MKETNKSRTANTTINASIGGISKILVFIVQFIARTIFIQILGTEYLGVNGLFTNILTILSFAELGIGNAIIFKLYKPIADNDEEKIKTYMNFYKKAYIIIGSIVLAIGIIIVPFLNFIIKGTPNIKENIQYIYILFLINSSVSYFFTYKKSIIIGYQKEYIVTLVEAIMVIVQNIFQVILLYIMHDYVVYLLIQISCTILNNVISAKIANKMYPYILDKKYSNISQEEEKNIFKDVKSIILYKIGNILSTGTDNIIISSFVGVGQVGVLSNYTTITNALSTFMYSLFNGFTASVGNLNTIEDNKRKEGIYYQIILLSFWVYGFMAVELSLLLNDFIYIWLGSKYVLNISIAIILALNLYVDGMRYANYTFRNTMGLFRRGRLVPLISSITNIILSIILVKYIGIFGVLFATFITRVLILTVYDPYILHRYKFNTSPKRFYITYVYYLILLIMDIVLCNAIICNIDYIGVWGFIAKGTVIAIITIAIFVICTYNIKEYNQLLMRIKNMLDKKIRKEV